MPTLCSIGAMPDDSPRPSGAEASWYRAMERRVPSDGPLASVEEVALVRGFEPGNRGRWDSLFTVDGTGRLNLALIADDQYRAVPRL